MDYSDHALAMRTMQVALALRLVVVCVNVAILVYARTATRGAEIAVGAALGAGRHRIVAQLFVEAPARAAAQLGGAVAVGLIPAVGLELLMQGEVRAVHTVVITPIVIAIMTLVGVFAAIGHARRGLAIQPIDALREG